jgi:hypothetical protein
MGLTTWATDVLAIAFYASEASGIAYVKASGDRARVHTYIDDDIEPDEACAWIARQPTTRAGQLQIVVDETVPPSYELRFTTERTLTPVNSSSHDAYASQARRLYVAWQARDVADLTSAAGSMPAPMADPLSIEPDTPGFSTVTKRPSPPMRSSLRQGTKLTAKYMSTSGRRPSRPSLVTCSSCTSCTSGRPCTSWPVQLPPLGSAETSQSWRTVRCD